jgi:GNAT superfamily N-acetyltransferase
MDEAVPKANASGGTAKFNTSLPSPSQVLAGDALPLLPDASFSVRKLTKHDLDRVLAFRKGIFAHGLDNPDHVYPEPDEIAATSALLEGEGISFGVFDDERLIAYTSMCLPNDGTSLDESSLSTAIKHFCELGQAAYMATNMVDRSYRNKGINSALVEFKHRLAPLLGRQHRFGICSTANGIALHNQLKRYAVAAIIKLEDANFGVLTRFLTYSPEAAVNFYGPVTWVNAADEAAQMELLRSKHRGVQCRISEHGLHVGYRPFC